MQLPVCENLPNENLPNIIDSVGGCAIGPQNSWQILIAFADIANI